MNARNKHLLRATVIVSALMPVATGDCGRFCGFPPAAPAWTWSGFYIGGSVGTAAGSATFSDPYGTFDLWRQGRPPAGFLAGPSAWLQLAGGAAMGRGSPGRCQLISMPTGADTCMQASSILNGR